jgi:hypothetical protein
LPISNPTSKQETFWGALFAAATGVAVLLQSWHALHWGQSSWQMTDWLIDYSGGFVRRGLAGEGILIASRATGIPPNLMVIGISLVFFAILTAFLVKSARRFVPLPLIFSGLLLGAPAMEGNAIRKDAMILLVLVFCLWLLQRSSREVAKLAAVNLVAIVALLCHESFFFLAIPALVLVAGEQASQAPRGNTSSGFWRGLLSLSPAIIAMGVISHFHGNQATARAIDADWHSLWLQADPATCCTVEPQAAIDSMQWSVRQGIALSAECLHQFSHGIWVPLAWLVLLALSFYFFLGWLRPRDGQSTQSARAQLAATMVFQLVMVSPLFVLGRDFGRWIFLWLASSLILHVFGFGLLDFAPEFWFFRLCRSMGERISNARLLTRFQPRYWYLLLAGLPACCWTVEHGFRAAPAGYYLRLLLVLTHHWRGPL